MYGTSALRTIVGNPRFFGLGPGTLSPFRETCVATLQRITVGLRKSWPRLEAMKPFLEYGWQPQVMAVAGRSKVD